MNWRAIRIRHQACVAASSLWEWISHTNFTRSLRAGETLSTVSDVSQGFRHFGHSTHRGWWRIYEKENHRNGGDVGLLILVYGGFFYYGYDRVRGWDS